METVLPLIEFFKILLLFLSILNVSKESFRLYKSIAKKSQYEISKQNIFLFGISLSYILTLIFI